MKCAVGRVDFDIEWDHLSDGAEFGHDVFCLYDYHSGCVYGCDKRIGYVSGDPRACRAYDFPLRSSAWTMDQYRDHS